MEKRAEDLIQHGEQAARGERRTVERVLAVLPRARDHTIVDRAERVVAEHELRAVLDRHVDVGGASHAAVDVVDAANARGLVEAGQRGRGLHRFGDRRRAVLVVSEHDPLGGVEVHRHDEQFLAPHAVEDLEIVRQLVPLDVLAQIDLER